MTTIMVQVTDKSHTLAALHAACSLAQANKGDVALLNLIPVNHPGWLGSEWGNLNFTDKDRDMLKEYQCLAESYGVHIQLSTLQAVSSVDAIVWAAECVNAEIVFAHLPPSIIPFLRRWKAWQLRRRLKQLECGLYLSNGDGASGWIPVQQPSVIHN